MAKTATIREPELPWLDTSDDRRFFRLVTVMLLLFVGAGIVLNTIQLPEVVRQNLIDVSPRLAKLILEKQKVKPPPQPEAPLPEKEVKKKKEPPKPEKKKEVEKKKVKKKSAREVAENSGLLAAKDELEDMRELFNLDEISSQPQQTSGSEAVKIASSGALLTAGAQQSSGGIQTDTLNRNITTSELAQRKTTSVESKIASGDEQLASASQKSKTNGTTGGKRSSGEIERVFQVNKGAIFNIYNRALRKNPSLAGKVVVELTIASNGEVTNVKILSSELGDKALERKLVLKIKRFKFSKSNRAETTVTYPIDFLPS
jgi:protein TonB